MPENKTIKEALANNAGKVSIWQAMCASPHSPVNAVGNSKAKTTETIAKTEAASLVFADFEKKYRPPKTTSAAPTAISAFAVA